MDRNWLTRNVGVLVFVTFMVVLVAIATWAIVDTVSSRGARDAKFRQECLDQGGRYVKFDNYRPSCVIDGEKFWR